MEILSYKHQAFLKLCSIAMNYCCAHLPFSLLVYATAAATPATITPNTYGEAFLFDEG